jgi:phage baseplate assembly protein W
MRALQISNGDLVIGQGGYQEVTGRDKVTQDLTVATLTPYGADRFHPGFGSTLGNRVGDPINAMTVANVQAEIQRVITNYMLVQKAILQAYQAKGYEAPYSTGDLVVKIRDLDVQATQDTLNVVASVETLAGQTASVTTQVTA